jgi:hypothetical protein
MGTAQLNPLSVLLSEVKQAFFLDQPLSVEYISCMPRPL